MTRYAEGEGGVRIAWDETGEGPPVLLVHGIGFKRARWSSQVEVLAAAGFRTVRFDLRGFGDSAGASGDYGLEELMGDFRAVVRAAGLGSFHLVGHSLGGMLSMQYAVENPQRVRSLVLASATSHNGRRASAFARVMVWFSERGFDAVMADRSIRSEVEAALAEAFPGIDPPLEMLRVGLGTPSPARAGAWRACIGYSTKDRLAELRCPVLVTHGSADPLIPFRAGVLIHEAIAHSEWKEETGAGHSLPSERADSFNEAMVSFLRRAERS